MSQRNCCVPGCYVTIADGVPLHRFPDPVKYADRFSAWLTATGGEISLMDASDIHSKKRVCRRHFEPRFIYPSNRLCKLAVPNLHMPALQNMMEIEPVAQSSSSVGVDVEADCTEIEYLKEDEAAVSDDDSIDNQRIEDTHTPSSFSFEQDLKLALDDIDLLFLSNAITFRSLAKQFQSMLKLDIAKLFSRYELKNATLHSGQENNAVSENIETLAQSKTPVENVTNADVEAGCTEIEYLEEVEAAVSDDDSIDKQRMEGTHSPSSFSFEQDLKLALDDIDLLFLSYAKTFRSLAKQFQSMLKLDIPQLFSRYELKNATLNSEQENNAVSENTETLPQSETPVENVTKPETEPKPSEAAFVSLKETVFRRVPLKEVPPEVIQVTPLSISPAEESKADYKIFRVPPVLPGSQVIRTSIPSDPSLKYCKIIRPITQPRISKPTSDNEDNNLVKTSLDPVVQFDRLDIVTEAQGELTSEPPP